ncbi:hypothetical protein THASP1DRAFT_26923, partial [Thamnocephalis sphaerospora]
MLSQLWTLRWLEALLLVWLSCVRPAGARLVAEWNGTTIDVPTSDFFMHRTPYYERNGVAILWPWIGNSTECTMHPVASNLRLAKMYATRATQYQDLAFVVYWPTAFNAGCKTLAQVGLATQEVDKELQNLGYPPLNLIVMLAFSNDETPLWGRTTVMYYSASTSVPDGPPDVDMMLLDQQSSRTFDQNFHSVPFALSFSATQEPGSWNDVYLSTGYTVYSWFLFVLVLAAFAYALARFIVSLRLKMAPRDLRLCIVVVTFIYCTILLAYYVVTDTSLA